MTGSDRGRGIEEVDGDLLEALATLAWLQLLDRLVLHGGFALRQFHGGVRATGDLDLRCRPRKDRHWSGTKAWLMVSNGARVRLDLAPGRRDGWGLMPFRFQRENYHCPVSPEAAIVTGEALTLAKCFCKRKDREKRYKEIWDVAWHVGQRGSGVDQGELEWRMSKPTADDKLIAREEWARMIDRARKLLGDGEWERAEGDAYCRWLENEGLADRADLAGIIACTTKFLGDVAKAVAGD